MIYLKQTKYGGKKSFWVIAAILFFALVLMAIFGIPKTLSGVFVRLGLPFWTAKNEIIDSTSAGTIFASRKSLISQVESLSEKLTSLNLKLAAYNELVKENADLKKLLGRRVAENSILAEILTRPPVSLYDTFILDVGSDDGVAVGDRVVADGIYEIGEIKETDNNYSKAVLYSSPKNEIRAIVGPDNIEVKAIGIGGGAFVAEVPQENKLSVGDGVVLPGISLKIFGYVERIETPPASVFKFVYFRNPVNLYGLRRVLIDRNTITKVTP